MSDGLLPISWMRLVPPSLLVGVPSALLLVLLLLTKPWSDMSDVKGALCSPCPGISSFWCELGMLRCASIAALRSESVGFVVLAIASGMGLPRWWIVIVVWGTGLPWSVGASFMLSCCVAGGVASWTCSWARVLSAMLVVAGDGGYAYRGCICCCDEGNVVSHDMNVEGGGG